MSAIAGVFHLDGRPCEPSSLDALATLLRHRAQDGTTTWSDGPAGLVHGRFITTPESADEHQPVVDAGSRAAITFDGRLDNRTELLRQLGVDAVDHSGIGDAELVLRLYRALGVECVARLLGDFAFSLWDGALNRLLCARDHLGLKPFCYRVAPDRFAWASEAGALARYDGRVPPPNEGMIAEHLAGMITSTRDTVFQDIFRLPPAHLLTADNNGIQLRCYWAPDLGKEIRYSDPDEYVDELRDLVRLAVAARLRVRGVAGISLSGGIDSAAVTGVAAELCRERAVPATSVEAFSLLIPGAADESAFWSQVVDRWGLGSASVPIAPLPSGQLAAEARFHLDLPNSPLAALTDRLRVCMRERGARVALTGSGADDWLGPSSGAYAHLLRRGRLGALAHRLRRDAADEWFMGWQAAGVATLWPLVPPPMQWAVRRVLRRGRPPAWVEPAFAARVGLRERVARRTVDVPRDCLERYDTWYESMSGWSVYLNEAIERSSGRAGVEMWHPFMDRRMVDFGLALPPEQRWRDGRAKHLLRRAMAPYLPTNVASRTTSPDATHLLFEGLEPEGGRALFQDMTVGRRGWVREAVLLARFDRAATLYRAGDRRYARMAVTLWGVAAIELWARAMASETVVQ